LLFRRINLSGVDNILKVVDNFVCKEWRLNELLVVQESLFRVILLEVKVDSIVGKEFVDIPETVKCWVRIGWLFWTFYDFDRIPHFFFICNLAAFVLAYRRELHENPKQFWLQDSDVILKFEFRVDVKNCTKFRAYYYQAHVIGIEERKHEIALTHSSSLFNLDFNFIIIA
jgi:hypothetical protein